METARAAGITTALVVPRSGFFPGQSSLVNLTGTDVGRMVMSTPVAFHVNLTRTSGMAAGYPGSQMGIIAFVRQTLMDAQHYQVAWTIYRANPGAERPAYSRSLEALEPAIKGQMPVVMPGNNPAEIQRTLDMAEAFKLNLILAGGAEAQSVASLLKERNVPVLLNVDYPTRNRNRDPEAREDLRALRRRVEAPGNAAALQKAGVKFAFQSDGTDSPTDFLRNVGLAIDAGLDKDVALRALTITPAEILGVADRLGSVEPRKIANLILTTGDLFDPETQVKYTFVDGQKFDIPQTQPARTTDTEGAGITDVAGQWILTVDSPQGVVEVTLELQQQGSALSGTTSSMLGTFPISEGSISGKDFNFRISVDSPDMGAMVIMFSGSIEGSKMTGTIDLGPMGLMDFTGSRNPSESHFAAR
jgi:imidazolonepropionase-like amidohydrolase